MKPIVTWIVISDARTAFVVANHGPGKGLEAVPDQIWDAPEVTGYSDDAGVMQSSTSSGHPSLARTDLKRLGQNAFAADIMDHLVKAQQHKTFDRIVLTGAPQMLGALRDAAPASIKAVLLAELDKDLTQIPLTELGPHLDDIMPL